MAEDHVALCTVSDLSYLFIVSTGQLFTCLEEETTSGQTFVREDNCPKWRLLS
jgi:hypothetical protein